MARLPRSAFSVGRQSSRRAGFPALPRSRSAAVHWNALAAFACFGLSPRTAWPGRGCGSNDRHNSRSSTLLPRPPPLVRFFIRPAGLVLISADEGCSPNIERRHQASNATGISTSGTNHIAPNPTPSASTSDIATTGSNEAQKELRPPRHRTSRRLEVPGAKGR